jgi:hypothetical protein
MPLLEHPTASLAFCEAKLSALRWKEKTLKPTSSLHRPFSNKTKLASPSTENPTAGLSFCEAKLSALRWKEKTLKPTSSFKGPFVTALFAFICGFSFGVLIGFQELTRVTNQVGSEVVGSPQAMLPSTVDLHALGVSQQLYVAGCRAFSGVLCASAAQYCCSVSN